MRKLMNIMEFAEYMRYSIEANLPENLKGARVKILQDGLRIRLQVILPYSDITFYYSLNEDYKEYFSGHIAMETIVARLINNGILYRVPVNSEELKIRNYGAVRERIIRHMVSDKALNSTYLHNRAFKPFEDTSIVFVYEIFLNDRCYGQQLSATIPITEEILHAWGGISVEELDRDAVRNTPRLRPALIRSINEFFSDVEPPCGNGMCPEMLVVTNVELHNGAVAVTYPLVRQRLMEVLQDDVYLLTSSIHECIVVAQSAGDPRGLYQIVREINGTQVERKDYLATDVLEYTQDGRLVSATHHQYGTADKRCILR